MSIINQMLKDLDKRQQPHQLTNIDLVPKKVDLKYQGRKVYFTAAIVVTIALFCLLIAYYWWQAQQSVLKNEIATLKQQQTLSKPQQIDSDTSSQIQEKIVTTTNTINSVSTPKIADKKVIAKTPKKEILASTNTSEKNPSTAAIESVEISNISDPTSESESIQTKPLENNLAQDINSAVSSQFVTRVTKPMVTSVDSSKIDPQIETESDNFSENKPFGDMAITPVKVTPQELAIKRVEKAMAAEQRGRFDLAEQDYSLALNLAPEIHQAREQLAALYYGQGKMGRAKELLQQGILLYPEHLNYLLLIARIKQGSNDYEGALESLETIPDTSVLARQKWAHQGDLAQKLKQFDLAETAYRKLLRSEPTQGRWWMGLAYSIDAQGRYSEAARVYKTAIGKSGLSPQANDFIESRLTQLGATL